MSAVLKPQVTFAEYLAREQIAQFKSEFYRGEIFAMSGGSPQLSLITGNIATCLRSRLRGSPCRPYNSDLRIRVPANGLTTYPDVSVVCGELQLDPEDRHAINNPSVIIEVLSSSTASYDRGKKFDLYRGLESLREYILIAQDEPYVERFVRQSNDAWLLTVLKGTTAILELPSLGCQLPLSEIYEDVAFTPEED